ncbi:MAG: hypothetical protein ACOVQ2_00145 [Flavobacterium sp.]
MKPLFLYCFLIINIYLLNAQEIVYQIVIIDNNLENPVENATVTVFKTKENYLSNKNGIVKFALKGSSYIEITHSDYKTKKIRISNSIKSEIKVILESKIKQLEEVIVTQKHPQEILKSIIKNSLKQLKLPANLKIYNKEFYKYNDEYCFFSDGLLNFQIYKNSGNVKSDILVEQSRSLGLKKPLEEEIWGFNLNLISEKYYTFGYFLELLNKNARKEYQFSLKSHSSNDAYNIIEIKPLEEINKLYYEYKITFDYKNKIILETEINIPFNKKELFLYNKDSKNRRINKMQIKQTYINKQKEYYLYNSMENIEYFKNKSKKEVKIEVKNIMHTIRFYDFLFEYNDNEVFKKKSLIASEKNLVLTNYWEYHSGVYMNDEESKILNYLEIITPKTY